MRVLHLIDPGSPGGGACTLRLLAEPLDRLGSVEQDVLVLGTRDHVELAARCGVAPRGQLGIPTAAPAAALAGLRRFIAAYERANGPYDIVHAWSPRAAMLASLAAGERHRLATFAVGPVTEPLTAVLIRMMRRSPLPILAGSTAVEREYRSLGVDGEQISVHPPAVNPDSVDGQSRESLRERWEIPPDAFVVGLLSEPVGWADVRIAAEVAARVSITGRDVRVLAHHAAARRADAERRMRNLGRGRIVIVDDDVAEPWRVVAGLDAALLLGGELNSMDLREAGRPFAVLTGGGRRLRPMPGILPLLWAMSAAVPVVAEASDAVRDVVEDGVNGLLVNQHDVKAACDRIRRLYDDRTIAGRIGFAAREHIADRFHVSAYCVRLKDVYERLAAGRPVRVISEYAEPVIEDRQLQS